MELPPFALERYFARHEFTVHHNLAASDCESTTVGELLALEPGAADELARLPLGYTETAGHPDLRRAIASLYESIDPTEVVVHVGAEEAIFTFMNAAFTAGDHVVVQTPAYQSLVSLAEAAGAVVTRWWGREEESWRIDPAELPALLLPSTRVVIVNLPHNPTGFLMDREDFQSTVEIARERGLVLFSDEVYRDLERDPAQRLPAACDLYDRAVSLGVMSKSFGLAGLRIGWIATHDASLRADVVKVKDYLSICCSAPAELLARTALAHRATLLARNRSLLCANLAEAEEFFARHRQLFGWQRPIAGPVSFPRLLEGGAEAFCRHAVEHAGVLLAPGSVFGVGDHHVRMGFGRRDFAVGLEALDAWLKQPASSPSRGS